ncbi:hypothetical protein [Celeribacter sp.]|uniref:hypothetical protein n=1 Tax=Celeribacter sp. TaxID=1890673 RepID=UPI003A8D3106
MLSRLLSYITGPLAVAGLVASLGLLAWVNALKADKAALEVKNAALAATVAACEARQSDITEHEDRSDEIDMLGPDDLRDRAFEWVLPF